uniref:Class I histocompatibility antigen, F10 alpha chain-like n=1 Tax=Nothoprocta perdicaria TaxID=30464 RepID=A0A8C6ZI01_NOTPE
MVGLPLLSPRPPGPHSLRYFYTGVTEPSAGLPAFVVVGVLDGQVEFVRYDSETRRTEPRVPWMQREGQQYWDRQTQIAQSHQQGFHVGLDTLQKRYNQSGGYHTVQRMCGCDILENGEIRGYEQYAYDGRDFIALNKDALTYTAADSAAVITKRKWEQAGEPERMKNYLDEICVEWLRKYVEYGKAALERREPPAVKVSGREDDERLTLSCRAHGFYPRPIVLTWLRDGAAQDMETRRSSVAPNGDGTYHTWATIEVLPEHRAQYVCRVEHASLTEPGFYSWGERGACGAPAVLARGGFAAASGGTRRPAWGSTGALRPRLLPDTARLLLLRRHRGSCFGPFSLAVAFITPMTITCSSSSFPTRFRGTRLLLVIFGVSLINGWGGPGGLQ